MRRVVFFISVLIVYFSYIFWSQKATYLQPFDASYWKERFETSQWVLPLSERIIGDDGLYLTEGYRLIQGGDPSAYNAEMPPLGKYLIGASIRFFGNGNIYGYITTSLLVVAVWFLVRRLTRSTTLAWATSLLVASDPLITGQFRLTMLDSLHATFLVLHVLALYGLAAQTTWKRIIFAGVCLGLFAGVKAPLLVPVIALTGVCAIFVVTRKIQLVSVYALTALAVYLGIYTPYFLHGHTLIDWVRLQKWIISFYLSSELHANIGSVFTTLLANQTKNLFSDAWYSSVEWTVLWPCVLVATLFSYVSKKMKVRGVEKWITWGTVGLLLAVFAISPFWVRYLILVLPFLYIIAIVVMSTYFSQRLVLGVILVGIVINFSFSFSLLHPTAEKEFTQFSSDWEHGFFHDMRERFTQESKAEFSREALQTQGLTFLYDMQIEALDVRFDSSLLQKRSGTIVLPVEIAYRTRYLGEFIEHTSVQLVQEDGVWRVKWDWESFMKALTRDSRLETTVDVAKRGTLDNHGVVVSDEQSVMISITPGEVDRSKEEEMLLFLSELFPQKLFPLSIHQRYIANTLPDRPRAIAVLPAPVTDSLRKRLLSYPGISLTPTWWRVTLLSPEGNTGRVVNTLFIECCSLMYSTTSYDGAWGYEQEYNATLKGVNGGTVTLYNADGTAQRIVLTREKQDGRDVILK